MKPSRLLLLVAVAAVVAACGSTDGDASASATEDADASPDLAGTSWVLASITLDDVTNSVAGDQSLTLRFDEDGTASGSTGCNRFTAGWTQDGYTLSLQVGAVTMAACASAELSEQEAAYIQALGDTQSADVDGDGLRLAGADGTSVLAFDAGLTDVAGTSWTATGINNQRGGVESSALTSSVTAEFSDDGALRGFGGCRDYTATYETGDGTIAITDVAFDGAACEGDAAALEEQYAAGLAAASTFTIEAATLNLRDSDGATQVNYAQTS